MIRHVLTLVILAVGIIIASVANAACTSPAGTAGSVVYNADYHVMQFCDGTSWYNMATSDTSPGVTIAGDVVTSGNGAVTATIPNGTVTYAKMQNVSATNRLIGRSTAGAGDPEEITIGSGLSLSGTTLSAAGGGFSLPVMTKTARDALSSPAAGTMLVNSTSNDVNIRVGTQWMSLKGAGLITVTSATYGGNCSSVAAGNVTSVVASLCDDQPNCSFSVNNTSMGGDPQGGCPKDFSMTYQCGTRYMNYWGSENSVMQPSCDAGTGYSAESPSFSFTDQTGVTPSTVIASNTQTITLSGPVGAYVTVSGSGSPTVSINGGSWATSGVIYSGQTLQVRMTSGPSGVTNSAIVAVGSSSDQWDVTTAVMGQQVFTANGTFTVPATITSISAVTVGKGGTGGGAYNSAGCGGDLRYVTSLAVTPGETLTIEVAGASGTRILRSATPLLVAANGTTSAGVGSSTIGGSIGGGNGGCYDVGSSGRYSGGGGAGGYSGNGGKGAQGGGAAYAGSGGGAAGGDGGYNGPTGGGGGGVGLLGQGNSGTLANGQWNLAQSSGGGGAGGSGGTAGALYSLGAGGGSYGGGGGAPSGVGGPGAVRIIWGPSRAYPSTNTGDM